jgi:hypothetical protein
MCNSQSNMVDHGVATIRTYRKDDLAVIEIEDNAGAYCENGTHDGLGIRIVDKRIKFLLGNHFGTTVLCVPNEMTRVTIQIPVEVEDPICVLSNRIKLIDVSDVEYVRSDIAGRYVVCGSGEFYTELTLKVLENRSHFVRCHKQYMVNLDQVDEIILGENLLAQITTKAGRSVPVSRRHLKKLKERFEI